MLCKSKSKCKRKCLQSKTIQPYRITLLSAIKISVNQRDSYKINPIPWPTIWILRFSLFYLIIYFFLTAITCWSGAQAPHWSYNTCPHTACPLYHYTFSIKSDCLVTNCLSTVVTDGQKCYFFLHKLPFLLYLVCHFLSDKIITWWRSPKKKKKKKLNTKVCCCVSPSGCGRYTFRKPLWSCEREKPTSALGLDDQGLSFTVCRVPK